MYRISAYHFYYKNVLIFGVFILLSRYPLVAQSTSTIDTAIELYEKENNKKKGYPVVKYILDKTLVDDMAIRTLDKQRSLLREIDIHENESLVFPTEPKMVTSKLKTVLLSETIQNLYSLGYDGFWKEFTAKYGKSGYLQVSEPIFSKDRNAFIIILESHYYKMGGVGSAVLYKKIDGQWSLVDEHLLYY